MIYTFHNMSEEPMQTVHYTLVCDHKRDCLDGSDETFCEFRRCPERRCQNKQCVTTRQWCDGMQDCTDGIGQMFIYVSVRQNSLLTENAASRDAAIARRLTTIVVSDFLCWFPIGLLGLLASTGNPIPGEINVAMAIFVLPLNSALNPFLYTFNVIMEKRREAAEARMLEHLMKKVTDRTPV
nr:hypothetical protein BaRGS_027993 [Batillaria attramentaria]